MKPSESPQSASKAGVQVEGSGCFRTGTMGRRRVPFVVAGGTRVDAGGMEGVKRSALFRVIAHRSALFRINIFKNGASTHHGESFAGRGLKGLTRTYKGLPGDKKINS